MTRIHTLLSAAWANAEQDFRVSEPELQAMLSANRVEIARNPLDSIAAAAELVRRAEARLAATSPAPTAPRETRGVSARTGRVSSPEPSPEQQVAQAQLDSARRLHALVSREATGARELLRETMGQIRAKAAELVVDDADEREILRLMNSVPEHMRPALVETILRDGELHASLSWGIDGDNNTAFDAFIERYRPQ